MLLDMSLRISNISLTCFDIVRCSLGSKLRYELDMMDFELDAKTDFYKIFFFFLGGMVVGISVVFLVSGLDDVLGVMG